jgi:asparagine synthase (glutamine-hydrolysing)
MQCDAPFGAYLSGGVDSSTVATLMSRFHDRPLKTFCLGYEDEADGQFTGKAQDILHARRIAERIGSEHHEFFINARLFEKELPSILAAFDEPFSGTVSTYFLSILIRRHVKVAISGDGADELFASYLTHRLALPMRRLLELRARGIDTDGLDAAQRASLAPFDSDAQLAFLARIADEREEVWRDRLAVFPSAERARLLRPEFLDLVPAAARVSPDAAAMAAHTASDPLNAVLETEQVGQLPNQVLAFVDRLSMWHSIEVRCPFLDHRIVEFANRLPGSFKIAGTTNKAILKRAVADLLPADLIARPKEGFVQPVYSWMRGPLVPLVRQAFAELPKDVVARPYAEMLLQRFLAGDASLSARVWNLVCFSLWLGGL